MRLRQIALGLLLAGGLSACDTVRDNAGACPVPPALRADIRPKPPVSEQEQVFQPGYWEWNGTSYAWREGSWVKKGPGVTGLWMDGYWKRDKVPQPCYWIPAHWVN
jgi:hypothetical protein